MKPDLARQTEPSSPSARPVRTGAPDARLNDRLCHLFRASLKTGRIHPLYLPVLKYRHAQAGG